MECGGRRPACWPPHQQARLILESSSTCSTPPARRLSHAACARAPAWSTVPCAAAAATGRARRGCAAVRAVARVKCSAVLASRVIPLTSRLYESGRCSAPIKVGSLRRPAPTRQRQQGGLRGSSVTATGQLAVKERSRSRCIPPFAVDARVACGSTLSCCPAPSVPLSPSLQESGRLSALWHSVLRLRCSRSPWPTSLADRVPVSRLSNVALFVQCAALSLSLSLRLSISISEKSPIANIMALLAMYPSHSRACSTGAPRSPPPPPCPYKEALSALKA